MDQALQLAHHLGVAPQGEVGGDAGFGRLAPGLFEAGDRAGGERVVGEVGQCRAPPQGECGAQAFGGGFVTALGGEVLGFGRGQLEAAEVGRLGRHDQRVAGPLGHEVAVGEQPLDPGDHGFERALVAGRGITLPEAVGERLDGEGAAGVEHQLGQHRPALRPTQGQRRAVGAERRDGAEDEVPRLLALHSCSLQGPAVRVPAPTSAPPRIGRLVRSDRRDLCSRVDVW